MRKITTLFCLLLLAFCFGNTALAQDAAKAQDTAKASELARRVPDAPEPPIHYFHLDFLVQELGSDGKPVNSRSYSSTASTGRPERDISIRTGSRIPVPTGEPSSSNYQYMDVGISIDVRNAQEVSGKLAVTLAADISSLAQEPNQNGVRAPVIRNNRWQSPVLLPINKPTVVFTSDALDTKGSMRLTVTATPLQ